MATKKPKRTLKKAPVTVRERSQQSQAPKKTRRLRSSANSLRKPFVAIGALIVKLVRPFGFLLRPFKTRPVRFIGRLLAKILLISYFRSAWAELRQVTWPNRRETWQLTFAVFIFALVFGIMIAVTDFGLDKLFEKILITK